MNNPSQSVLKQHDLKVTMKGRDLLWTWKSWSQTVFVDISSPIKVLWRQEDTCTLPDDRMCVLHFCHD